MLLVAQFFAKKRNMPWVKAGVLSSLDSIVREYPSSKYDYAIKYNPSVHGHIHKVNRTTCLQHMPEHVSNVNFVWSLSTCLNISFSTSTAHV